MNNLQTVAPPRTWCTPHEHYLAVLDSPWYRTVVELQHAISVATTAFWTTRNALTVNLPITTGSISSPMGLGSDSTPVKVDLEGIPTYLADSMQFMLEYGCRLAPEGCYYIMPSFRGEPADDTHLCQFFHSEAEIPGGLEDVISAVEAYVAFVAARLLDTHADNIVSAAGSVAHLEAMLERSAFARLTFDEAAALLRNDPTFIVDHGQWRTMTRAGERQLLASVDSFIWVTHMDHLSVPFYQAFGDARHKTAANADLLFGIGEIVGSGERHATGEDLLAALELHRVPPDAYAWYLAMKQRHPLKTSGFGMGVERFLLWVLQHDDIRDIPLLLRFNGEEIVA